MTFETDVKSFAYNRSIDQMFKGRYFDITLVDKAMEAQDKGSFFQHEMYSTLKHLHCVYWDDMPDHIKKELPHILTEILKPETLLVSTPKPSLWARLTNK